MTDKCAADGSYRIIYLQELLDRRFSAGTTQVICPITDAFGATTDRLAASCRCIAASMSFIWIRILRSH